MSECTCGQQLGLWKTPVDNPAVSRARDSMPIQEINLLNKAESVENERSPEVDALINAVDLLAARIDAMELYIIEILGIISSPWTAVERVKRVREIRQRMGDR
jgi:hypothetical protein